MVNRGYRRQLQLFLPPRGRGKTKEECIARKPRGYEQVEGETGSGFGCDR